MGFKEAIMFASFTKSGYITGIDSANIAGKKPYALMKPVEHNTLSVC
jgi:hypothetical protein